MFEKTFWILKLNISPGMVVCVHVVHVYTYKTEIEINYLWKQYQIIDYGKFDLTSHLKINKY